MPRIPRRLLVDLTSTNHCTWRSHNRTRVFDDDECAEFFLDLLGHYKTRFGILIHSFCLMGTHPHVLLTSTMGQESFSSFWRLVNQRFARFYNRKFSRRGQVVMERLRSPAVQGGEHHMLTVMRYGDLNPVRAGLVVSAAHWKHSSYRHYAYGERHALIDDAPEYLALAQSPAKRRVAYRCLFGRGNEQPLLERRRELVDAPFVGETGWVSSRRAAIGLRVAPDS